MTSQTGTSAVKVGLLVIVAAVLMYAGFVFLGGRLAKQGKKYFVHMSDAGGVVKGTRVAMAGVHIGEVTDVKLLNPRSVRVELSIDHDYSIPAGSVAEIPTQFISIGEAGMVIVPPDLIAGDLPVGSIIEGRHPGPLDNLFPDSKTTVQTLTQTLSALRDILRDEDLKGNIKHLLNSTTKTIDQFNALAASTNKVLVDNQIPINAALRNASLAMEDVHKSTSLVAKMLSDGRYQTQMHDLLAHLDQTSDKAGKLIESLNGYVNDPALHNSLKNTLDSAQALAAKGNEIADKTSAIAGNGVELSKRAVALTDQASDIAKEAHALLVKLEGLIDKVGGKVDNFDLKLPKSPIGPIKTEVRALRDTKPNYNRADVNFSMPIFGTPLYFGLFDAFGSNRLNLQVGRPLGRNAVLRYGAYAGTAGLGVDYSLAPRIGLSADVFNANKPRFDALAKYDFGKGYDLWLGFDRIFDRNGFTIGVGVKK